MTAGKIRQFMVVSGKERPRADAIHIHECLRDGPGNAETVECTRPSSDLVQNHQAAGRGVMEDVRGLGHFHHKRALALKQIIRRANAREDSVRQSDPRGFGRNKSPHLSHQHDQGRLSQIRALAGHIGPTDDHETAIRLPQIQIVGDKSSRKVHPFDHRMATVFDHQEIVRRQFRTAVPTVGSDLGQRTDGVDERQDVRQSENAR